MDPMGLIIGLRKKWFRRGLELRHVWSMSMICWKRYFRKPFFRKVEKTSSICSTWKSRIKHLYMNSYSGRVLLQLPNISMFFLQGWLKSFLDVVFRKICLVLVPSMKFGFTAAVNTYMRNKLSIENNQYSRFISHTTRLYTSTSIHIYNDQTGNRMQYNLHIAFFTFKNNMRHHETFCCICINPHFYDLIQL